MKSKHKFLACLLSATTLFSSCPGFTTCSHASSLSPQSKKAIGVGVGAGLAGLIFAAVAAGIVISKNHKENNEKTEEKKEDNQNQNNEQHNTQKNKLTNNGDTRGNNVRIVYFKSLQKENDGKNGNAGKNFKYKYFLAPNGSKILLPFPQELSSENNVIRLILQNFKKELEELCSKSIDHQESNHFVVTSDIPREILDRDVIGESEEIKPINQYLDAFNAHCAALLAKMLDGAEKEEEKKEIDDLVLQIQKIYSFAGGANLEVDDQIKLAGFNSKFGCYSQCGQLNVESLREALQNGVLDKNQLEDDIESLSSIVNKSSVPAHDPTEKTEDFGDQDTSGLLKITSRDLVRDAMEHYNNHDGNLERKRSSFIGLINRSKSKDTDINLSFLKSFFEQSYSAPYRILDLNMIYGKWGINGETLERYLPGCQLEEKLKEMVKKWFGECQAETGGMGGEDKVISVVDYIFDDRFDSLHNRRFCNLVRGSLNAFADRSAAKLFVQMLYSLEEEAKRLNITPQDLNDRLVAESYGGSKEVKAMTAEQYRFYLLWHELYTALGGMSKGCHLQVQGAILRMAKCYDAYQLSQNTKGEKSEESVVPVYDITFCQLLREEATAIAVNNCPKTKDAKGSAEFSCLIRSVFVPLVNVMDNTNYKTDERYSDYGETYETLAAKWKEAASSFNLIQKVSEDVYSGINSNAEQNDSKAKEEKKQFEEFANIQMTFDEFVSILKSIDKSERSSWEQEIDKLYNKFKEYVDFGNDKGKSKRAFDSMGKWKGGKCTISFQDFKDIIFVELAGNIEEEEYKILKLLKDNSNCRTIAYILHLANSGLIAING